jgi:hypothetical protein
MMFFIVKSENINTSIALLPMRINNNDTDITEQKLYIDVLTSEFSWCVNVRRKRFTILPAIPASLASVVSWLACLPLHSRFAGSNPAKAIKSAVLPSEGK